MIKVARARATNEKRRGKSKRGAGLHIPRHFTRKGEDPFATVEWELRTARISSESGETGFEQDECEIPKPWSQLATNVVVSKYFRGHLGTPARETRVRQLIGRVVGRMTEWGQAAGSVTVLGRDDPTPPPQALEFSISAKRCPIRSSASTVAM